MPAASRLALAVLLLLAPARAALAYPLDGFAYTGIARLAYQRRVQIGELPGRKRPPGELLPLERVGIRLADAPDFTLPASDPALVAKLRRLLGAEADRYGLALLDLSDREHPRYAEWHGDAKQNPGSVGKLLVALGIFQALADAWPDDIAARERVLRQARIVADVFSVYDHHTVPYFDPETNVYTRHPIQKGDTASLWTYLDWMMSPSSNSAAGMLQKHLILLAHYGRDYPVSREEEQRFFAETPRKELEAIFAKAMQEPVTRNGLDLDTFRQGSFFTHEGKRHVGGTSSYATAHGLMDYLVQLEKGRLVDAWSSREIKRLMYVTERRIRYGSSGVLWPSAVYFKSGSLYSCMPEEGFVCRKYHGNKRNYMNSVAIIETPAGQDRLYYMVTVLSNVLRKNSAEDHRDLARAIHGMLLADHPPRPVPPGALPPSATYGEGFIGYAEERAEARLKVDTQEALLDLGYEIGDVDGIIGGRTRKAIREFEASQGRRATGTPSKALLELMESVARERGLVRPAGSATGGAQPEPGGGGNAP